MSIETRMTGNQGVILARKDQLSEPIGGGNSSWLTFAQSLNSANRDPFPCFPVLEKIISGGETAVRLVNNSEGARFVFGAIFLSAYWADFTRPTNSATPSNKLISRNIKKPDSGKSVNRVVASKDALIKNLNCPSLCKAEDPQCLLIPYRNNDSDGSLKRLRALLLQPIPFQITPSQLGEVFHMQGDPSLDLRGTSTFIKSPSDSTGRLGLFSNDGQASILDFNSQVGNDKVTMKLSVPKKMVGVFSQFGESSPMGVKLQFGEDEISPSIQFSSTSLDDAYGGVVREAWLDQDDLIFTTARGCLQAPLRPLKKGALQDRKTKIATMLGATSARNVLNAVMVETFGSNWCIGACGAFPVPATPYVNYENASLSQCACGGLYGTLINPLNRQVSGTLVQYEESPGAAPVRTSKPLPLGPNQHYQLGCVTHTMAIGYSCLGTFNWDYK